MAKTKTPNHLHVSILFLAAIALVAVIFAYSTSMSLAGPQFGWSQQVGPKECDQTGAPVINVTQKIVHTVDSGEAGNNWAYDDLNRQIQVWQQSDNTYCALIDNQGKFDSQPGQASPGNTGTLTGKEDGTFKGGYRAVIVGSLKASPAYKTHGSIGTFDFQCDLSGNCPGYVNWVDSYFSPGYQFSYQWWGWQYQYKNKVWTNSSDGNTGDIL